MAYVDMIRVNMQCVDVRDILGQDMCWHDIGDMLGQDIDIEVLSDETLSHQVNYMLLHPDVQAKVQEEVDQVLLGFS